MMEFHILLHAKNSYQAVTDKKNKTDWQVFITFLCNADRIKHYLPSIQASSRMKYLATAVARFHNQRPAFVQLLFTGAITPRHSGFVTGRNMQLTESDHTK